MAAFAAVFFVKGDGADFHGAVDSFAHIINGQQGSSHAGQGFHFHAGFAAGLHGDVYKRQVLAFARGLGEFGATAMIAGNIAGQTRTLPLAIYSEVAAGNMEGAYDYVLIIVCISLLVIFCLNWFTSLGRRFMKKESAK